MFTKLVLEEALRLPKQRKGSLDDFYDSGDVSFPGARGSSQLGTLCALVPEALRGLILDLVPQK